MERGFRKQTTPADQSGGRSPMARLRRRYARGFTRPSAFLMFWTLGSEMPRALLICEPVFPDSTSFFTLARVSSVIMARLRRFAFAAPFEGLPRRAVREDPEDALSAFTKSFSDSYPDRKSTRLNS